jgi:hypothetical protein
VQQFQELSHLDLKRSPATGIREGAEGRKSTGHKEDPGLQRTGAENARKYRFVQRKHPVAQRQELRAGAEEHLR